VINWKTDSMENLCQIGDGNHSSKYPKKSEMVELGVPFIRGTNLIEGTLCSNKMLYISPEKHEQLKKGHLKSGDVLFTNRGEIGKVAIVTNDFDGANLNSQIAWLRCGHDLFPEYLFYFLQSNMMRDHFELEKSGAALQQFTIKMLKVIEVHYPPIPEQQRIVAILDQAFAEIEKARANAEQNLKNARELFDSYLQQVFSQRGEGWVIRSMSDKFLLQMIDGDRGKNYPKKSDFDSEGHCLFLSTKNVRPDGFKFEETMFISKERDNLLRKGRLERNDVLITTRGTIGNLALFDNSIEYDNIRINSGMLILRPNITQMLPSYLFEIMRSSIVKNQITDKTSGAAQPQLPIQTLNTFSFPVPESLNEQKEMVVKLKNLEKRSSELQAIYTNKLSSLYELKKSLLQKAFTGELSKSKGMAA
jgi:type I restriction enzyme, S subunit